MVQLTAQEKIDRLSPVAANYAPTTRCIMCDAPVHRTEYDEHLRACVRIERGLADRPVERPVDFTPEPIPLARRRRGL